MIGFREIHIEDAQKILDWRTSERVTRFMKSDIEYDLKSQIKWLETGFERPDYYHWIIQFEGRDVGLLSFMNWRREDRTVGWSFYIGEERALGMGGLVPPYFYNLAFDVLGVDRVIAEILYNNTAVINLYLRQGYVFD